MTAPLVGAVLPEWQLAGVRESDIFLTALILRDPNPIHWSRAAVRAAGMGDRHVNQGGATMAYVMNLLQSWVGSRSDVLELSCTFRGNVLAGDPVTVSGTVTETRDVHGSTEIRVAVSAHVDGRGEVLRGTGRLRWPGREPRLGE